MIRRMLFLVGAVMLVASQTAQAKVVTKPVEYADGDVKCIGYFAYDDAAKGPVPGIVVVPEWWGLNDYAKHRAEALAKLGYAALAVDMYGDGKVVTTPQEAGALAGKVRGEVAAWRKRAMAGLDALKAQPQVNAKELAAIGYCFGGSTAIELAYAGAPLKGIVSFHGALPAYNAATDAKSLPKMLICHGAADTFVPESQVVPFREGLDKAGADWQMTYYAGAKHAFTNPDAGKFNVPGVEYNEPADERSWHAMRGFFQEIFGK